MSRTSMVTLPSIDELEITLCCDKKIDKAINELYLNRTITRLLYKIFSDHTFCATCKNRTFGYIIVGTQKPFILFALAYLWPLKIHLPIKFLLRYAILREPSIMHIVVARDYRRRGLANRLMHLAENHIKETLDANMAYLTVRKGNNNSIAMYKNRGYEIYGSTLNGKKYKMRKLLTTAIR